MASGNEGVSRLKLIGAAMGAMMFAVAGGSAIAETPTSEAEAAMSNDAMEFLSIDGEPMSLADYSGDVVLVVNTASKCGFTPQYEGLQALWTEYKDKGLTIVGIPSGDFAGQEFADNEEVKSFCQLNYGVTFPLTEKNHVKGDEAHPFYTYAKEHLGDDAEPKWNFHKVLLNREGVPIKAFNTRVEPQSDELVSAVKAALG